MNTSEEKEVPIEQLLWLDLLRKELDETLGYKCPDTRPNFKFKLSGIAVIEPVSQHVIYPFDL